MTPPIALDPYSDENAPLTTSVLSIIETGMSDHKAPFESPVSEGLPSRSSKTLFPIPPPATSDEPLIDNELTFMPLVLLTVTPCTSSKILSKVSIFFFLVSSELAIEMDEGVYIEPNVWMVHPLA